MVYRIPESKKSIGQNLFEFELPPSVCAELDLAEGSTYSIPKAKFLTAGQIEQLAENPQELKLTEILDLLGRTDEAAGAIRRLDTEQLMGLMQAWTADSGFDLGESSAST